VTERNRFKRPLTELQQAILDFVWSRKTASSEQVREGLMPRYSLKDSTVRTLLRRLEHRGYVTHRRDGKVFVYEAAVAPRSVAARAVEQIIERFCAGSVEQFLVGMVDEKVVSADVIRKLAKKIQRSGS
jgi:BlaI family transcriptional regulator, penicillinase repressor